MLVDEPSPVVLWECNGNPWQLWFFTNDGSITLSNNTGAFPATFLFSLIITEIYVRPVPWCWVQRKRRTDSNTCLQ